MYFFTRNLKVPFDMAVLRRNNRHSPDPRPEMRIMIYLGPQSAQSVPYSHVE